MRTKLLLLALALIIAIVAPLVLAQIIQTQSIHVSGTANYPRNYSPLPTASPVVTVAPTSSPSVKFSLWFPNGTSCPTTLTNLPTNIYGPLDSVGNPATTRLTLRNDGNVPINVTVSSSNVNVPSNLKFNLGTTIESNPIAPGKSADLYIAINMVTTNTNFVAQEPFSYSFDITVTAAQA